MSDSSYAVYVGVGWADTEHGVIVLNAAREPLHAWIAPHTGAGLTMFATGLTELAEIDQFTGFPKIQALAARHGLQ